MQPLEHLSLLGWFLDRYGLSTAVLAVFLFIFTGWIPSPLTDQASAIKAHVDQAERALNQTKANEKLLQQICRNTAKTDRQLERCEE